MRYEDIKVVFEAIIGGGTLEASNVESLERFSMLMDSGTNCLRYFDTNAINGISTLMYDALRSMIIDFNMGSINFKIISYNSILETLMSYENAILPILGCSAEFNKACGKDLNSLVYDKYNNICLSALDNVMVDVYRSGEEIQGSENFTEQLYYDAFVFRLRYNAKAITTLLESYLNNVTDKFKYYKIKGAINMLSVFNKEEVCYNVRYNEDFIFGEHS